MGVYVRALAICLCFLAALPALAQPVRADSGLVSRQEQVRHQLAAASASVSELDGEIANLDRSIVDTNRRIRRERQELRLIARTLYAQPESGLMALLSASSPGDALTRLSDLTAAGDRAAATERALDQDLSSFEREQVTLEADRQKADHLRQQLDAQFRLLQSMAHPSLAQPAVPRPAVAPRPAPAAAPAPAATSSAPPGPAPTAAPAPAPAPPPPGGPASIQQIIVGAFAPLGTAAQSWALRVARCESHNNPDAVNPSTAASGLFQFMPSTWALTPYASKSVFDATANAEAAAWYYKKTGETGGPWSCK
jgi:hypothetical protein